MLYDSEYWALKRRHTHKLGIAEMRISIYHTIKDNICNDHIHERVGVALIGKKIVENHLRLFTHVQRRQSDTSIRRVDKIV